MFWRLEIGRCGKSRREDRDGDKKKRQLHGYDFRSHAKERLIFAAAFHHHCHESAQHAQTQKRVAAVNFGGVN